MSTAPKSATKEEVRARYHGLTDHVRSTGFEAAWIGLQGVVIATIGALFFESPLAKAGAFLVAIVFIVTAIGIARAAEWSRLVGGVSSLLLGIASLVQPYLQRAEGAEPASPKYTFVILALLTGVHLLLPSTRVAFANARAARDRAREAKARR